MGTWRRKVPAVWFWFSFLTAFQLCASLNREGAALLRFEEAIGEDPYGAMKDWDEGGRSPCSRFGVECSADGRVMAINVGTAAVRRLLASKQKDSHEDKIVGSGTPTFAPSMSDATGDWDPSKLLPNRPISPSHPRRSPPPSNPPLPPPPSEPISPPPASHTAEKTSTTKNRISNSSTLRASIGAAVGVVVVIALLAVCFFSYCHRKASTVVPLSATTTSRQLQTAATEGITLFRRSELEKACEGFSNIIGTLPGFTLYKGTLPCGAEIAVVSTTVAYAGDWSTIAEAHYMNKVEVLSKVNHKNLMNLVGYCEDETPFVRMMVFEYVSNGSLFERLHAKEAEHLNWQSRLRIVMGIIYCLYYMHQQHTPVTPRNLNSSCIYLTEDNAAKVSDISFCIGEKEDEDESDNSDEYSTMYKFALLLLETISGRRPYSEDDGLLVLWAQRYLTGVSPVMGLVDPTLDSVPEEHVSAFAELIRLCVSEDRKQRPSITEVTRRMQQISGITQDQAIPRNSALWWAELEIITS